MSNMEYSLDLLKRINAVVVDGEVLSHRKILNEYNVWMFFQSSILSYDIRAFCTPADIAMGPAVIGMWAEIKKFIVSCISVVVSFLAILSLYIRKAQILVLSVDKINSAISKSDTRIDPVYIAMSQKHVRYSEVFHTILGRVFLTNFFARKRLATYLEAIDAVFTSSNMLFGSRVVDIDWQTIDLTNFTDDENIFVRRVIGKYLKMIQMAEFRVECLKTILKYSSVKMVFAIDSPRDYNEIILASKLCRIPSYGFQHGRYTKYDVGYLNDAHFRGEIVRPDYLYVWSEYWKEELLRLGTFFKPEEILVGGSKEPKESEEDKSFLKKSHADNILNVLIPYETGINAKAIKTYIDAFLACSDVRVIFKLRADTSQDAQFKLFGLSNSYHPHFEVITNTKEALKKADVCVGSHSTFLYDVIGYCKPVIVLDVGSDLGEGLLRNKLADSLSLNDSICIRLKEIAATPMNTLIQRKEKLFGREGKEMKNTVVSIIDDHIHA